MLNKSYISIIKDGASVGKCFICEADTSFLSTLNALVPNELCTVEYLKIILDTINFKKYMVGSGIPHIYFNEYKNEKIKLISYNQQKVLSKILNKLSVLITINENKLLCLNNLKKSLLQQMFI